MPATALNAGVPLVVAGSLNMDWVGRAPRIPGPGETVLGHALQRSHGGKGGNQAVAAARLGAAVRFHGAVGGDATGDELIAGLQAEGIDTQGVVRVAQPSGAALITVADSGENAITVLPGANLWAPVPGADDLAGAKALLLQLEIPLPANLAWARAARRAGVPVILNAAPMSAGLSELLAAADVLIVNEVEWATLTGSDSASGEEALHGAARLGPATVVVTLGARGSAAWREGRGVRVPGRAVPVADSTGAGDTFAGAFAMAHAQGLSLAKAMAWANAAAALSCTRVGARAGMPHAPALAAAMTD